MKTCLEKDKYGFYIYDLTRAEHGMRHLDIHYANEETKEDVMESLSLIIPNSKITLTPRALLLNYNGSNIIIDEGNFKDFQETLRQVFCLNEKEEDFNPANAQAAKIAEKIKQGRAKVAHLKGEDVGSVYARYISTLSVGLKIPLSYLLNYTIYQIRDLMERFNL